MAYKRRKGKSIVKSKSKIYPFKGIDYKSPLERNMAILLDAEGIEFEYEPISFELQEAFMNPFDSYERQTNQKGEMKNRGKKKLRNIEYTPDFVADDFIIETKGYANETFPMRWKMFKKHLLDKGYDPEKVVLYKPQNIKECERVVELIKQYRNERKAD